MPQPANFRMSKAYETQVQLSWDLLDFKKHDKNTELAYYVQVTDDRGYMVGQQQLYNKTIAKHLDHDNKTVYCWVENLIPGKSLTATLQVTNKLTVLCLFFLWQQSFKTQVLYVNVKLDENYKYTTKHKNKHVKN